MSLVDRSAAGDWDFQDIAKEDRESVAAMVGRLRQLLPEIESVGACRVRIQSEVPRGAGFGSSASLCAALVRAALSHVGNARRMTEAEDSVTSAGREWLLAHELEKFFHGTPSGVDTGLSLREGTWAFHPRPPELPAIEHLSGPLPSLVVAAVPRDESTGALVADLTRRLKAGTPEVIRSIDALGGLAAAACGLLRGAEDAADALGRLADQAMTLLRGLGLSVPGLDRLLEAGHRAGALGGKLSGAGGGGAFFLVTRGEREAREVALLLGEEASRKRIRLASAPYVLGKEPGPRHGSSGEGPSASA